MKGCEGHEGSDLLRSSEQLSRGVTHEVFSPGKQETHEAPEIEADVLMLSVEQDAVCWSGPQSGLDSALACQEAVARSLLGEAFSAERLEKCIRLCERAEKRESGDVLEKMGLEVTRETGCGLKDICQVLGEGGKVIVRVNGVALRYEEYARRPGVQADHTVQVIGVDRSDPKQIQMIVNDPGAADGRACRLPQKRFEKAWKIGDCAMISVYR